MKLIDPTIAIILLITLIVVVVLSLFFIFKHEEKQGRKILWTLFVLLIPFIGSIIYTLKYIIEITNRKKA